MRKRKERTRDRKEERQTERKKERRGKEGERKKGRGEGEREGGTERKKKIITLIYLCSLFLWEKYLSLPGDCQ